MPSKFEEFYEKHKKTIGMVLAAGLIGTLLYFLIKAVMNRTDENKDRNNNNQPTPCTNTCENGGQPGRINGACGCSCKGQFTGISCEIDKCKTFDQSCSGQGKFSFENDECKCKCHDDYDGIYCQDKIIEFKRAFDQMLA